MSRIAKNPVLVPKGVDINLNHNLLTIKGSLGELTLKIHPSIEISHQDGKLSFARNESDPTSKAMIGTTRSLVFNMVIGVSEGFTKQLKMVGVGYRAQAKGDILDITAGFSHPVNIKLPEGIKAETPSATDIIIKGIDKQVVGQTAADIRAIRPPEPYKGKGIRYLGEHIVMKEGKKK